MISGTKVDAEAAQAYLRRAREAAWHIPGMPGDVATRPIRTVGVIGAGTMGCGIAMAFANAGFPVLLNDISAEALALGVSRIRSMYESSVLRGRISAEDAQARASRIRSTNEFEELSTCDLAIEAVYEDMRLKQDIFGRLDAVLNAGAILATNTSGLDIDRIAESTTRPQDVVGAHFFSPAHVQKLLEVVRGRHTAPDCVTTLMDLARQLGKVGVVSANYPGFIGNALFRQYIREAHFLVEDGALPHEVDAVLEEFGFTMGVFAVHDLAGNDVGWKMRKQEMATRPTDRRWNDLILELCDMGRLGQKVGKGWYAYDSGSRTPRRDAELEAFIVARSARLGLQRRVISREEILERCLFSMVNEAARLLEARVALRASDVDLVFVTGYGFPADLGGPLHLADSVGLRMIHERVRAYHDSLGAWWEPAPLLTRLATSSGSFSQLDAAAFA